jgi:hypothetical protein
VEVVPHPGYEIVKEEDKNILIGDNFMRQSQDSAVWATSSFFRPGVGCGRRSAGSGFDPTNGIVQGLF